MDHLTWLFSELARTDLGRRAAEQFAPASFAEVGEGTPSPAARAWPVEQSPLPRSRPAEMQTLSLVAMEETPWPVLADRGGEMFTPEELSRFFERDARRYG